MEQNGNTRDLPKAGNTGGNLCFTSLQPGLNQEKLRRSRIEEHPVLHHGWIDAGGEILFQQFSKH
jgi:hypothetical protein